MKYISNNPQLIIGCPYNDDLCSMVLEKDAKYIVFTSLDFIMSSHKYFEMYNQRKSWFLETNDLSFLTTTKHAPFYREFIEEGLVGEEEETTSSLDDLFLYFDMPNQW